MTSLRGVEIPDAEVNGNRLINRRIDPWRLQEGDVIELEYYGEGPVRHKRVRVTHVDKITLENPVRIPGTTNAFCRSAYEIYTDAPVGHEWGWGRRITYKSFELIDIKVMLAPLPVKSTGPRRPENPYAK